MTAVDFITELFCKADDKVPDDKHSRAVQYPSEVVTPALLYALKGSGRRAFRRWLIRDYRELFPNVPDRTRLFRLFGSHQRYIGRFPAEPSLRDRIDSSRPRRTERRSDRRKRHLEPSADCRRKAVLYPQQSRVGCQSDARHGRRIRRFRLSGAGG